MTSIALHAPRGTNLLGSELDIECSVGFSDGLMHSRFPNQCLEVVLGVVAS